MGKIDIDKFICSLLSNPINVGIRIKIESALKEQDLYFMESIKEIVSIKPLMEPEYDPHSLPVGDDSNLPRFDESKYHPRTEKKKELTEFEKAIADIADYCRKHTDVTPERFAHKFSQLILDAAEYTLKPKFEKALSEVKGNIEDEYEKGYRKAIKNAESYLENILEEEDCKFGCSEWTELRAEYESLDSFIRAFRNYIKGE